MTNFQAYPLWQQPAVRILTFFLLAWLIYLLARLMARIVIFIGRLPSRKKLSQERLHTLESLFASGIRIAALAAAAVATISQFVDAATVVWVIGLLSAGFGLAARPIISDMMTGISFIFENTFSVGEKVQLSQPLMIIEGVIETISLRTTWVRAPTGDLYAIPNGEIRIIRNFSRGSFSMVSITLNLSSEMLDKALPILNELGKENCREIADILEPWQIINKTGKIGQQTELTLLARSRLGKAADLRPRLLAQVHERLRENGIELLD
jgi:moderate conductance mechanosensitive channel